MSIQGSYLNFKTLPLVWINQRPNVPGDINRPRPSTPRRCRLPGRDPNLPLLRSPQTTVALARGGFGQRISPAAETHDVDRRRLPTLVLVLDRQAPRDCGGRRGTQVGGVLRRAGQEARGARQHHQRRRTRGQGCRWRQPWECRATHHQRGMYDSTLPVKVSRIVAGLGEFHAELVVLFSDP